MAASCSCIPLPLAQPSPLLPAAGKRGLGGKGQAERGGASSPLVTLINVSLLPPPLKPEPLPLAINIYFATILPVICQRPLQKTIIRGGDVLYERYAYNYREE